MAGPARLSTIAVIPARYAASRLPGKVLLNLAGRPMIQHVYERTAAAPTIDRVLVATDDERIADAVRAFGGDVRLTRADHTTGTDRLAEVAADLEAELIVNVQGDEPLIEADSIDRAVRPLRDEAGLVMSTLRVREDDPERLADPNLVKVVVDRDDFALYFSRQPIPYRRQTTAEVPGWAHVGLYVYRREFLLTYAQLPPTPLQLAESLEQLRALEHGYRIKVVETPHASIGVDTEGDLVRVRAMLGG